MSLERPWNAWNAPFQAFQAQPSPRNRPATQKPPRHPGRQSRSGIALRMRRAQASPPCGGELERGVLAQDWFKNGTHTPLPSPPPQGGRETAPYPANDPGSPLRFVRDDTHLQTLTVFLPTLLCSRFVQFIA